MKDERQPFQNSRLQQRGKRRKTNIILNSLIVLVLLLIVIVSVQIFFKDDKPTSSVATDEQVENVTTEKESKTLERPSQADKSDDKNDQQKENKTATVDDPESKGTDSVKNRKETEAAKDDKNKADKESDKKDSEDIGGSEIVTEGGNDPDVKKTIVNPAWEPVGTAQTGEHSNSYGGVDWDEMVQSIAYATGIDEGNMTIHYLGNNGENKSVGTIQAKDTKQKYRVYIEWVDGKGWKPTLVEELTE